MYVRGFDSTKARRLLTTNINGTRYVVKTHNIAALPTIVGIADEIVVTAHTPQEEDDLRALVPSIAFVQRFDELGAEGVAFEVERYAKYFGLDAEQSAKLHEYFRYWDVLRRCCGKQMAIDWREMVRHRTLDPGSVKPGRLRHDVHDASYHACDMYNITDVELRLLGTAVLESKDVPRQLLRTSDVDGEMDGTYCAQCDARLAANPRRATC